MCPHANGSQAAAPHNCPTFRAGRRGPEAWPLTQGSCHRGRPLLQQRSVRHEPNGRPGKGESKGTRRPSPRGSRPRTLSGVPYGVSSLLGLGEGKWPLKHTDKGTSDQLEGWEAVWWLDAGFLAEDWWGGSARGDPLHQARGCMNERPAERRWGRTEGCGPDLGVWPAGGGQKRKQNKGQRSSHQAEELKPEHCRDGLLYLSEEGLGHGRPPKLKKLKQRG